MDRSYGTRLARRRAPWLAASLASIVVSLACGSPTRRTPEPRPTTPVVSNQVELEAPVPLAAAEPPPPQDRADERKAGPLNAAREADRSVSQPSAPKSAPVAAAAAAPQGDMLPGLSDDMLSGASVEGALMARGRATTGFGVGGGGVAAKRAAPLRQLRMGMPAGPAAMAPQFEANTERYAHATDNRFQLTTDAPLSTFSIDVDTASYANVRRFLRDGALPPPDAVRIEELVNYFHYDYPEPAADQPVSVTTEVAAAPWAPDHRLVRIGLRTRAIDTQRAPASNLVFLIDVSGSMSDPDKLPLLKRGLSMLAQNLRENDRVAIVVYAGASGLVLPSTPGSRRADVIAALERLDAGGSTNGADGIRLAYQVAQQHFVQGGTNRVILATDGDFNVGTTSEGELVRLIEEKRKSGVFLTVLGFGRGNLNDSGMEALADHGNGSYAYVDSIAEAHKVLVRQAGSTLITVAKDVKLQLEWNPARVQSYRLIGFENRVLAARDFNDDKKDAGELGAGHTMTALYEIVPANASGSARAEVDPLRYQAPNAPTAAAASDELLTLKIRYKKPDAHASQLMTQAVRELPASAQASRDLRWAAAVACFGMVLRNSEWKGQATLALANTLAREAVGADPEGQRHEFVSLIDQARTLSGGGPTAQVAR